MPCSVSFLSYFSSLFLSLFLPFSVSLLFFVSVSSSCRFSVCFLYRLLRLPFRFPAFLGGGFGHSVISSRCYPPPPELLVSLKCVFPLLAVFFPTCALAVYNIFPLFLPFFCLFRFEHRLFHPVFFFLGTSATVCCLLGVGFCCDSCIQNVFYEHDMCLDTNACSPHIFLFGLR